MIRALGRAKRRPFVPQPGVHGRFQRIGILDVPAFDSASLCQFGEIGIVQPGIMIDQPFHALLHFHETKGVVVENDELERDLLLHQRQQFTHQHGKAAIAAHGDDLAVGIGELDAHRLRHPARHGSVQQRVEDAPLAGRLDVAQHPHHRRACIGHEDRIVRRFPVQHIGDILRVDQVGIVFLTLFLVCFEILLPLLLVRGEMFLARFRADQR